MKEIKDRLLALLLRYPRGCLPIIGTALAFFLEVCNRHSLWKALGFPGKNPWAFLVCCLIVTATLAVSLLARRRLAVLGVLSGLWLVVGVIGFVIRALRITPFNFSDFLLIPQGIAIAPSYVGEFGLVLIFIAIGLAAFTLVTVYRRGARYILDLRRGAMFLGGNLVALVLAIALGLNSGALAGYFGNLIRAYEDYGFAYCFGCTLLIHGVEAPEDYAPDMVEDLLEQIDPEAEDPELPAPVQPNILLLQMESFFDPALMNGVTFSRDPIPVFRRLAANNTSGFFTAPAIGAGTVNTEFEVLTGMDLEFFGPGEYPYSTTVRQEPVESLPYVLKDLGYTAHAIHNHTGAFYNRHEVYPNLGFDSFTSIEYMEDPQYNATGWARDSMLTEQIMAAMDSTGGTDLVFAISVQSHGKYPEELPEGAETEIRSVWEGEGRNQAGWNYYINQLHQQDKFLGDLLIRLRACQEPVVLVVYGDHLPNFELEESDVYGGDLYRTEYAIWSNFGLEGKDRDLEASQLSAYLLELLDIREGTMFNAHQKLRDRSDYKDKIQLLQYDLLDGDRAVYGGQSPYRTSQMRMGLRDVAVTGVQIHQKDLFVLGEHFTPYSAVSIDGRIQDTVYISPTVLLVSDYGPEPGQQVRVEQISSKSVSLSESAPYTIPLKE